jgi:hypothetical protein
MTPYASLNGSIESRSSGPAAWLTVAAAVGVLGLALGGCAATSRHAEVQFPDDVRTALAFYRGEDGERVYWSALMEAIESADVIIVGEEHDDAVGHRVQQAVVEDVLARWPDSALSMEMLDRRKQQDRLARLGEQLPADDRHRQGGRGAGGGGEHALAGVHDRGPERGLRAARRRDDRPGGAFRAARGGAAG